MANKLYQMTPKEIVQELDKYIIGQDEAKKSVAIALRNRYRRSLLSEKMREEITPKNILIRAVRRPVLPSSVKKKYLAEVENMCREFHLEPTLYTLLRNDCKV